MWYATTAGGDQRQFGREPVEGVAITGRSGLIGGGEGLTDGVQGMRCRLTGSREGQRNLLIVPRSWGHRGSPPVRCICSEPE